MAYYVDGPFAYAKGVGDLDARELETPTMVHKHVGSGGASKKRRGKKVNPRMVENSISEARIVLELQSILNEWVDVSRVVTLDALLQSISPAVLAGSVVNGMLSKAIDKCRTDLEQEPSMCVAISIEIGRHVQGFRCVDDAVAWLTAIVIGAKHYEAGLV